jgi:hypothetical protein
MEQAGDLYKMLEPALSSTVSFVPISDSSNTISELYLRQLKICAKPDACSAIQLQHATITHLRRVARPCNTRTLTPRGAINSWNSRGGTFY